MSAAEEKCQLIFIQNEPVIVADSNSEAEYEETLAKAVGFLAALSSSRREEALTKIPTNDFEV